MLLILHYIFRKNLEMLSFCIFYNNEDACRSKNLREKRGKLMIASFPNNDLNKKVCFENTH